MGAIREDKESGSDEYSTDEDNDNDEVHPEEEEIYVVDLKRNRRDKYQRPIRCDIEDIDSFFYVSQIDTGCPISLIKK